MRIKNLNDSQSLARKTPRLRIYKGTQKIMRSSRPCAGLDYEQFFRLEVSDRRHRRKIIEAYSSIDEQKEYLEREKELLNKGKYPLKLAEPRSQNSVYLKELRILLPYTTPEKNFSSYFARRSTKNDEISGTLHRCNGERIYQETKLVEDRMGSKHKRLVECNEPCASDSPFEPCPLGCNKEGFLKFWILELAQEECYDECNISLHSYSDLIQIPGYLDAIAETRESASVDRTMYDYKHRICYILSRQEVKIKRPIINTVKDQGKAQYLRTGKSTDDTTWALSLQIDPEWQRINKLRRSEQFLLQAGQQVPVGLLAQAHPIDFIEATVIEETPELPGNSPNTPALVDWVMDESKLAELRTSWRNNNWTEAGLLSLLNGYGLQYLNSLRGISRSQFNLLKEALNNQEVKSLHCGEGIAPL